MTELETIKIMEVLNALYAGGNNEPRQQAIAWHCILCKHDFNETMNAVFRFAENDTRDYATFPTPGKIIAEIKAEESRNNATIKEIIRSIGYGKDYDELSEPAKALIPRESYCKWMNIKADEFAEKQEKYADFLRRRQQLQIEQREPRYREPNQLR